MKLKKPTIWGILISLLVFAILYLWIGLEGIAEYSLIIVLASISLILLAIIFYGFLYRHISWLVEPEDDVNILNLKMNQSLSFTLALLGFGIAFILSVIIPGFSFRTIEIVSLIAGFLFVFTGQVIFANEYLPRYQKLIIIYKIRGHKK